MRTQCGLAYYIAYIRKGGYIPTRDKIIQDFTATLHSQDVFLDFFRNHPDLTFQEVRVQRFRNFEISPRNSITLARSNKISLEIPIEEVKLSHGRSVGRKWIVESQEKLFSHSKPVSIITLVEVLYIET
jgi:hypothetical protein